MRACRSNEDKVELLRRPGRAGRPNLGSRPQSQSRLRAMCLLCSWVDHRILTALGRVRGADQPAARGRAQLFATARFRASTPRPGSPRIARLHNSSFPQERAVSHALLFCQRLGTTQEDPRRYAGLRDHNENREQYKIRPVSRLIHLEHGCIRRFLLSQRSEASGRHAPITSLSAWRALRTHLSSSLQSR